MSTQDRSSEQSMDDLLASIRRMISDDASDKSPPETSEPALGNDPGPDPLGDLRAQDPVRNDPSPQVEAAQPGNAMLVQQAHVGAPHDADVRDAGLAPGAPVGWSRNPVPTPPEVERDQIGSALPAGSGQLPGTEFSERPRGGSDVASELTGDEQSLRQRLFGTPAAPVEPAAPIMSQEEQIAAPEAARDFRDIQADPEPAIDQPDAADDDDPNLQRAKAESVSALRRLKASIAAAKNNAVTAPPAAEGLMSTAEALGPDESREPTTQQPDILENPFAVEPASAPDVVDAGSQASSLDPTPISAWSTDAAQPKPQPQAVGDEMSAKSGVSNNAALEGLVRDLVRPMVTDWLDQNLERIVRDVAAEELAARSATDRSLD